MDIKDYLEDFVYPHSTKDRIMAGLTFFTIMSITPDDIIEKISGENLLEIYDLILYSKPWEE